ncbi:uncharacterized protein LOC124774877 [Schistocerca piceifrons]|uniref:uncharacterized protein LOC124774877 n=1 Tax=Schistocerca piceifrons TaxID=274613 RepID=UPI001F5EECB2|nr:uncharacterized protein LOC124774877 [Schistocerca piceifrons]
MMTKRNNGVVWRGPLSFNCNSTVGIVRMVQIVNVSDIMHKITSTGICNVLSCAKVEGTEINVCYGCGRPLFIVSPPHFCNGSILDDVASTADFQLNIKIPARCGNSGSPVGEMYQQCDSRIVTQHMYMISTLFISKHLYITDVRVLSVQSILTLTALQGSDHHLQSQECYSTTFLFHVLTVCPSHLLLQLCLPLSTSFISSANPLDKTPHSS